MIHQHRTLNLYIKTIILSMNSSLFLEYLYHNYGDYCSRIWHIRDLTTIEIL